jgi:hypothetical protein
MNNVLPMRTNKSCIQHGCSKSSVPWSEAREIYIEREHMTMHRWGVEGFFSQSLSLVLLMLMLMLMLNKLLADYLSVITE